MLGWYVNMLQLTTQHYKVQQKVLWKESQEGRRVGMR